MSSSRQLVKCTKCGKEKFNTRLCGLYGRKRIICVECCNEIQKAGNCKVRGCPYKSYKS
ncbi:MAG: hypothetical protein ACTSRP_25540 [Candidatus Helarchaeota archaeon]